MKLLYGVLKAGNHWFSTYHIYHNEKRVIKKLIYNLCLLYFSGLFSIVQMQSNETLILVNNNFQNKEKAGI